MNIFNTNNAMIINLELNSCNHTKNYANYTLIYDINNNLIGLNIFDQDLLTSYPKGLLYPNDELLIKIKQITNIDLSMYNKNKIIYAKIIAFSPIPNTHLKYCDVLINDDKVLKIVCGADNVKKDMYTVVATNNAILPNGIIIKNGKVLNYDSYGMLCSWKELSIKSEQNGIIDLNINDSYLGQPFVDIYKNI